MIRNLHAYTEPGADYPAYISINRHADGRLTVTVRSRGNSGQDVGVIELTPEQLEQAATDVLGSLYGEQ